jgi:predicted ribosome quality control (RQC) complex YloA/Tae2 family protein
MKLSQLRLIAKRLNQFDFISRARRIEDNVIEVSFDKSQSYFFNMRRGGSFIYKALSQRPIKDYNAPFDNLLHSFLSSAKILSVEIPNNDRVLRFKIAPKSLYKDKIVYLQLEFTGKNTNAILLDEDDIVIEALRHIDSFSSFRVVRPSHKLLSIPPFAQKEETSDIDDIDIYLEQRYEADQSHRLKEQKKIKLTSTQKKIDKLSKTLDNLSDEDALAIEATKYKSYGNIILANLYQIKPYDTKLKTYDFDGNEITIKLPKDIKINRISDYFFNLSKRAKNRAKNVYIEKENLSTKINFYQNIYYAIDKAKSIYELELFVPKRSTSQRKKEKIKDCELFWIEGYKVLVGRNSKENQKLLSLAKSNDIWMHIRDIPSSHLIIKTDKQNLPLSVIKSASKLCVDFSIKQAGDYRVDYTKRKFVKVQSGSNVFYNKYETISVIKEGVEIRE